MNACTRIASVVDARGLWAPGVAGLLAAAGATAQSAAGQESLAEVVVTAQKREQKLQEVPIAVSIVGAAALEEAGGFNIEGLRSLVPTLNLRKTNTALNQALFLRGVGTINFAIAAQPSVAYVLDGVVMSSSGEAFGDLFDVERVEVLRGPQGTLFGKNSSAGVVNVISKMPGREYGGYIDAGIYEGTEFKLKAGLDTPLSASLRGRTTAFYGNYDGYIKNITQTPAGGDENGYHRKGVRTLWQADPSDKVRLTFSADYRKSDDNCCAEIIGTRPTGPTAAAYLVALAGTTFNGVDARTIKQNLAMRQYERAYGTSLQLDADLAGGLTLTSITAWRKWDVTEIREGDFTDVGAAWVGVFQQHDFGPQTQKTLSEELRVVSASGGFVDYVAGVYASKTDAERYFERDDIVCTASTLPPDATGLRPCQPGLSTITPVSANATFGATLKSLAAFGDGTFHVADRWRLVAGLRFTKDDLDYFHNRVPAPFAAPGIRTDTTGFTGSSSKNNVSGRAGVQWDASHDLMTYFTYARGYKGPAYNVFFNMTATDKNLIDAETADSFELGLKSTLLDGAMVLNTAVFDAKYKNFQANNFLVLNGTVITTLTNAGDVSTKGFEADFVSKGIGGVDLTGGIAYTDTRVDRVKTPAGSIPTYLVGSPLPFAPKWKGTIGLEHRAKYAAFDLVPAISYAYQTWQNSILVPGNPATQIQAQQTRIDSYGTVDGSLTLIAPDNRYRLAVIGHNLTNKSYAALLQTGGPAGTIRYQIPREASQYFGVDLRVNFGAR
jgi:iron complex outermembrane recepter protein